MSLTLGIQGWYEVLKAISVTQNNQLEENGNMIIQ